mmetsp:Transcript_28235/g.97637  ORF Transcript_28235/g.97637 Transcript_28235/m.97637 type:complete len:95 (-) Transcript_28235:133-417(-)
MPQVEESKGGAPPSIVERLEARERERLARKPLTLMELDNKQHEAEARREMELEAIKFKGKKMGGPAPNAKEQQSEGKDGESKDSSDSSEGKECK